MSDERRSRTLREFLGEGEGLRPDIVRPAVTTGITYLAGITGHGKTLHALEIALTKASGASRIGYEATPGPVLFIAADMAPDDYRRYAKLMLHSGRESALDNLHFVTPRRLYLDDEEGAQELRGLITEVGAELCIIDHFGEVCSTDAISNTDLNGILYTFGEIRDVDCVSLLILDQLRKESGGIRRGKTPGIDMLYGGRAKAAQADRVLMITKDAGSGEFTLFAVKERGAGLAPMNFTFDATTGWQRGDEQAVHLTPSDEKILRFIAAAPPTSPPTYVDIEERCVLAERTVRGSVAILLRYGLITEGPKRERSNTYQSAGLQNHATAHADAEATNYANTAHPYKGVQQSSRLQTSEVQGLEGQLEQGAYVWPGS